MAAVYLFVVESLAHNKLHRTRAVVFALHDNLHQPLELAAAYQVVQRVHFLPCAVHEHHTFVGHGFRAFLQQSGRVAVDGVHIVVEVKQFVAVGDKHRLGAFDRLFEFAGVLAVAVGCHQTDVLHHQPWRAGALHLRVIAFLAHNQK